MSHTVSVKGVQVNCRFDSRLIAAIHLRFGLVITPTLNTQVPYLIPLTSRTPFLRDFKGIQGSYRDISGLLPRVFREIVLLTHPKSLKLHNSLNILSTMSI